MASAPRGVSTSPRAKRRSAGARMPFAIFCVKSLVCATYSSERRAKPQKINPCADATKFAGSAFIVSFYEINTFLKRRHSSRRRVGKRVVPRGRSTEQPAAVRKGACGRGGTAGRRRRPVWVFEGLCAPPRGRHVAASKAATSSLIRARRCPPALLLHLRPGPPAFARALPAGTQTCACRPVPGPPEAPRTGFHRPCARPPARDR